MSKGNGQVALASLYNESRLANYPTKYSLASMRLGAYLLKDPSLSVELPCSSLEKPAKDALPNLVGRDVVGMSAYMWTAGRAKELANLLSSESPETLVVIGGPEASHMDVSGWPDGTIFVRGEGEEPLMKIAKAKQRNSSIGYAELKADLGDTIYSASDGVPKGVLVARQGKSIPSGVPLFSDRFMEIVKDSLGNYVIWDTVRGCPYTCGYCGHRTSASVKTYDLDQVEAETKGIGRIGIDEVFAIDPILGGLPGRDIHVLKFLSKNAPNASLKAYYRPEFLNEESLRALQDVKLSEIDIGIQTTNPNVPRWLRSNNFEKIRKQLPKLTPSGIPWRAELIVGLPGDDMAGLRESLRFVIDDLAPSSVYAYPLTIIPDTKVAEIEGGTDREFWVRGERSRATESNSYSPEELSGMVAYSGAVASLHEAIQLERKSSPASLSFSEIDSLVKEALLRGDSAEIANFLNGNREASVARWREILSNA